MTANLSDAKLKALRIYLGVSDGHITQLEKDYLAASGATGDSINDLWMDYLVNASAFPQDRGQINAMQYEWLGDLGFTGSLNERWLQYWDTMIVGNFDFTNGGQPLTALPAILTALNATYTRNSLKNVPQNGALVALSANQFGTSYDPVTGLYGYAPEPAATNLATNSDGNAATYTLATNVANGTAVPGFTNGIAFGDNSLARSAFKTVSMTSGTTYSVSVFVIMDDGGVPVVGADASTGDFCLISEVAPHASAALVRYVGNGVYRVSSSRACVSTAAWYCGVKKYTTQSARTFRITGIQVETGLRATSYINCPSGSTVARAADVLTVPLWVNNLKDSQDGSTANWAKTNCTCVTSGTAPDGSATAQLVTVSSTAVTSFSNVTSLSPAGISVGLTASVYVKQGNQATCKVLLRNTTNATSFTTGTLTFATGIIAGTGWTVVDAGGGWFRCIYKTTTSGDSVTVGHTMRLYVGFEGGSYASGDTVYAWGAQIEAGSVATTYRPTTSTLESAANANIAGFSSAGYTLAVDQRMDTTLNATTVAIEVSDNTSANRMYLAQGGGVNPQLAITSGSSAQASLLGATYGVARGKFAGAAQLNNILGSRGGVAMTPDTSALMPASPIFLHIGNPYTGSLQYNGFIFRAQLIPTPLTQAQLNGLTT